jgi:hypothetical protein
MCVCIYNIYIYIVGWIRLLRSLRNGNFCLICMRIMYPKMKHFVQVSMALFYTACYFRTTYQNGALWGIRMPANFIAGVSIKKKLTWNSYRGSVVKGLLSRWELCSSWLLRSEQWYSLPKFRNNLSVPSSKFRNLDLNLGEELPLFAA